MMKQMKIHKEKSFTNGFVASLKLEDGMLIETTATCLPFSTEMRGTGNTDNRATDWNSSQDFWEEKYMIGISTQSGCRQGCKFCAVTNLTKKQGCRNLTVDEIVNQVDFAIEKTRKDPKKAKLFRILYTRMGEPSDNIENVIESIKVFKERFPDVRIQISTIGIKKKFNDLIGALLKLEMNEIPGDWLEFQVSIHSTSDKYRRWLQNSNIISNNAIGLMIDKFYRMKPYRKWKVTLNFSLAEDTPFNVNVLKTQFTFDSCFIKISNINENEVSKKNKLKSKINLENVI